MIYNELVLRGTEDFPIELYHIDESHPRYEMSFHWHNDIEIIRILKGTLKVKLNNNEYDATEGDILFINPQTVHGATPLDNCIYECVVMNSDILSTTDSSCRFFIDSLTNLEFKVAEYSKEYPEEFIYYANRIFDCLLSESAGHKFKVTGAVYALFGIIIDNNIIETDYSIPEFSKDKNISKIKDILVFLRNNYDRQLTLDEIAFKAGMSTKYFCSFFKKMTNKTPIEYLISYRIEKASGMLLNSDMSITDIAYSCGFNDLSYFIKTFKKYKNTTPHKFRGK